MPRRREIAKREVPADPIYSSPLVTKFIRTIMQDGKRSTAERIMYGALDIVKEKTSDDPLKIFKKAVDNVKPALEVKSRRVGGSSAPTRGLRGATSNGSTNACARLVVS